MADNNANDAGDDYPEINNVLRNIQEGVFLFSQPEFRHGNFICVFLETRVRVSNPEERTFL